VLQAPGLVARCRFSASWSIGSPAPPSAAVLGIIAAPSWCPTSPQQHQSRAGTQRHGAAGNSGNEHGHPDHQRVPAATVARVLIWDGLMRCGAWCFVGTAFEAARVLPVPVLPPAHTSHTHADWHTDKACSTKLGAVGCGLLLGLQAAPDGLVPAAWAAGTLSSVLQGAKGDRTAVPQSHHRSGWWPSRGQCWACVAPSVHDARSPHLPQLFPADRWNVGSGEGRLLTTTTSTVSTRARRHACGRLAWPLANQLCGM
jgi:hypothetical protein